jgi:hypothetical protein
MRPKMIGMRMRDKRQLLTVPWIQP